MSVNTERRDESLCHSDTYRTLSCPDNHFIDMFPGGEHSPLAIFILDYLCPDASDRQSVTLNISAECKIDAKDLLMRQGSNNICAHALNL